MEVGTLSLAGRLRERADGSASGRLVDRAAPSRIASSSSASSSTSSDESPRSESPVPPEGSHARGVVQQMPGVTVICHVRWVRCLVVWAPPGEISPFAGGSGSTLRSSAGPQICSCFGGCEGRRATCWSMDTAQGFLVFFCSCCASAHSGVATIGMSRKFQAIYFEI